MTPVDKIFRIIFCAEPAFMRVDPVMTSGPVTAQSSRSATAANGDAGEEVMPMV